MSVLSSGQIIDRLFRSDPRDPERIFIVPTPKHKDIKDASVDLMLGNYFIVTKTAKFSTLAARGKNTKKAIASYQERVFVPFNEELVLHPGTFVLGATWQYISLPKNIYAQVFARSTWGRAGLTVATAVSVHPGFCGCLTLELVNNGNAPVTLYPGSRLAQIVFMKVDSIDKDVPIGQSKYCGMIEPSFSKLYDEFDELEEWKRIGELGSLKDRPEER